MDLKFEKLLKDVEELRSRMDKKSRDFNNLKHSFDELKSRYEKTDKHCVSGDNDREQYSRNWCLRFFGISVRQEDIDELGLDIACMIAVYNTVVKPVLSMASEKVLPVIPPWYVLFENGHFVGQAVESKNNPGVMLPRTIIIRFSLRWQRNLFLKLKKDHMPKPTDAERVKGIEFYSASPDLTKLNHSVKRRLGMDQRVDKVWSVDGRLRFTLVNDKFVFKVECVLDTNDQIIFSAVKQKSKSRDPVRPKHWARVPFVAQPRSASSLQPANPLTDPDVPVQTESVKSGPVQTESVKTGPVQTDPVETVADQAGLVQNGPGKSSNGLPGRRRQHAILLDGPSPALIAVREKHGIFSSNQDSDINVDVLDSISQ